MPADGAGVIFPMDTRRLGSLDVRSRKSFFFFWQLFFCLLQIFTILSQLMVLLTGDVSDQFSTLTVFLNNYEIAQ